LPQLLELHVFFGTCLTLQLKHEKIEKTVINKFEPSAAAQSPFFRLFLAFSEKLIMSCSLHRPQEFFSLIFFWHIGN
jgi:hypothetical protein